MKSVRVSDRNKSTKWFINYQQVYWNFYIFYRGKHLDAELWCCLLLVIIIILYKRIDCCVYFVCNETNSSNFHCQRRFMRQSLSCRILHYWSVCAWRRPRRGMTSPWRLSSVCDIISRLTSLTRQTLKFKTQSCSSVSPRLSTDLSALLLIDYW